MKQMIKIIRSIDIAKEYERALEADVDYWLDSLSHAIEHDNEEDKLEAEVNLKSITRELEMHRHRHNLK